MRMAHPRIENLRVETRNHLVRKCGARMKNLSNGIINLVLRRPAILWVKTKTRYDSLDRVDCQRNDRQSLLLLLMSSQVHPIASHIKRCRNAGKLSDLVIESKMVIQKMVSYSHSSLRPNFTWHAEWTIVHRFFVIMGGFHAFNNGKPLYPF